MAATDTGTISGVVTSSAGAITGAQVMLYNALDGGGYDLETTTLADSSGQYVFFEVPAGTYLVYFSATDHVSEWFDNVVSGEPTTVTVTAGATKIVSAQLAALPKITGTIYDPNGAVAAGASVCVANSYDPSYCTYVTSDSSGKYQISRYPGTYLVRAITSNTLDTYFAGATSVLDSSAATKVTLTSGGADATGKDIHLIQGATISGTVTRAGAAVTNARVCAANGACAYTDQGGYSLQVRAGTTKLTVSWWDSATGTYLNGVTQLSVVDKQSYPNTNIALSEGTGVSGTVTLDSLANGASIDVYRIAADGTERYSDYDYTRGTNNGFIFRDLEPGTYVVKVAAAGFASSCFGGANCTKFTVTKDAITPVGNLALTRLAPGGLTGKVLGSDGSGLAGVTVKATWNSTSFTTLTGGDGDYSFSGLAAGVGWQLSLEKSGYLTKSLWATPKASKSVRLDSIRLLKPSGISGKVTDPAGAGVQTTLYLSGPGYYNATSDASGNYSLPAITPGRYTVYIYAASGLLSLSKEVAVGDGKQVTADFRLQRPATLSGTLLKAGGAQLSGCVTLYTKDGDDVKEACADLSGIFSFTSVRPGTYTIQGYQDGYRDTWLGDVASMSKATWFTLADGEAATGKVITLQPLPGGTVSGTVKLSDGTAAKGLEIALLSDDEEDPDEVSVGADGSYDVGRVPSGTYSVRMYWEGRICGPDYAAQCSMATVTVGTTDQTVDFVLANLGSVSGSLTGADGNAVDWAELHLTDATDEKIAYVDLERESDFTFAHVPFGTYTLSAEANDSIIHRTVVVDGPETQNLQFVTGHSITGTIHTTSADYYANVRAIDPVTGETLAHDDVEVEGNDVDLSYELRHLPPGDYLIYVSSDAGDLWYPAASNPRQASPVTITNADRTGVDFTVAAPSGWATVTGTLRLPAGVTADSRYDYPQLEFRSDDHYYEVEAGADGSYRLSMALGDYHVRIDGSDELGTAGQESDLTISGDTTLDFTLAAAGSMIGQVVDGNDVGIEAAWVTVTAADGSKVDTETDQWGFWTLNPVPVGANSLKIEASGYRNYTASGISVTAGAEVNTGKQVMTGAGKLRVSLHNLKGGPNVTTVVTDTSGHELARHTESTDDYYGVIDGLPLGNVLVRFEGKHIQPEWWEDAATQATATPVAITADSVARVEPVLALNDATGTLTGTITNKTGETGVISVLVTDDEDHTTVLAAENGSYSISLAPGTTYKVRAALCIGYWMGDSDCMGERVLAWHGGASKTSAAPVVITAGQSSTVDLTLGGAVLGFDSTPAPTISGAPTVGSQLTLGLTGAWSPAPDSQRIEWLRDGVVIGGANASGYTLAAADAGKQVSVRVTAIKNGYLSTSRTSERTLPVLDLTGGTAELSGTALKVGETVTVTPSGWPGGVGFSYQWNRDGSAIGGATGAGYTAVTDDVGHTLSVSLTASKSGYPSRTVSSASTNAVEAVAVVTPPPPPAPPAQPALPALSGSAPTPKVAGTAKPGKTLVATVGKWEAGVGVSYQWLRAGVAIPGATGVKYKVQPADGGSRLVFRVTGSKSGYAATVRDSAATKVVPLSKLKAATPKVKGAAKIGKTVSAAAGKWTAGTALSYQWLRAGKAVPGATGPTYAVTAADAGKAIKVKVTGTKQGYKTVAKTSKATKKVR